MASSEEGSAFALHASHELVIRNGDATCTGWVVNLCERPVVLVASTAIVMIGRGSKHVAPVATLCLRRYVVRDDYPQGQDHGFLDDVKSIRHVVMVGSRQ